MSSNIEIVIEALNGREMPMKSELQEYASLSGLDLGGADDYVEQLGDRPAHIVIQWWDEKYGSEQQDAFCELLAEGRPDLKINLTDEWDDEGPGGQAWEWQGGRLTRSAAMEWVWTEEKLVSE